MAEAPQREQIVDYFTTDLFVAASAGDRTITVRSTVGAPTAGRFRIRVGAANIPSSIEWHSVVALKGSVWTLGEALAIDHPVGHGVAIIFNAAAVDNLLTLLQDGLIAATDRDLDVGRRDFEVAAPGGGRAVRLDARPLRSRTVGERLSLNINAR